MTTDGSASLAFLGGQKQSSEPQWHECLGWRESGIPLKSSQLAWYCHSEELTHQWCPAKTRDREYYQQYDFILLFQRASKAREVRAVRAGLNLFASSCQLGLWLDDKGFLHVCSRQTEGFWETANWPRSVPMHGLQCMILLPFKYLHCPCEAACNSSVALRSELSEACTSNISSSSRQRHSKVAEEPGECWHTPNMPKLSAGSCCCPRYITGIWAFRATSRQKRLTDLCWETRTHRPPMWRTTSFHHLWKRIGAKWMKRRMTASSNESCHMAWNFMCPWLRKAERYWVIVKDGLSRVQENVHEKCPWNILKKGLSHFDLACKSHQTDHVWSTGQAACILRIDVMQLEGPLRCT